MIGVVLLNYVVLFLVRSILSNGISTFLAFYFIQQFSKSNSFASMILSVFYGIGSIAALLGGGIADCFGHRKGTS